MATILVIDKNIESHFLVKGIITEKFSDTSFYSAFSGEEGVELAGSINPDVVIVNNNLDKMSAYEVCENFKAAKIINEIPLVFITNTKNVKVERKQALDCGADAFLSMPIDASEVIAQVRAMLLIRKANFQRLSPTINIDKKQQVTGVFSPYSNELTFEAVQNEQKLLRTLIDNLPFAIYVKDIEGRKLIANKADMIIMNSKSESDFLDKTDLEIFGTEQGESGFAEDMMVIRSGKPLLNKENHYIDIENEKRWRLISKYPLFDQNGEICGVLGFGQDITSRKKAEEALNESQSLYHSFVEHLPVGVFRKDSEGRYVFVNTRFCKLKGLRAEEILGKTPDELSEYEMAIEMKRQPEMMGVQRTLAVEGLNHHQQIMKTGKSIELEEAYPQPGGDIYYFQVIKTPVFSARGKVIGSQGIQFDITQRKQTEKAYRNSSELNSVLLKAIPFGIDIVDKTGKILFMNEILIKLFGADILGKKCWEITQNLQSQCANCPLLSDFEVDGNVVHEYERVIENQIYLISHIGMLFNGQKALLEIFQNITERKQAELELIKAKEQAEEADSLKTAFLANMSHEIRTPLNSILGFTELMADSTIEPDQQKEFANIINVSGQNLLSIINDIIDISKIEAGQVVVKKSSFSVHNMILMLKNEFEYKALNKGIQLEIGKELSKNEIQIFSDETKIRQVLINFISNALKFTEQGFIEIDFTVDGNTGKFQVKDTGIGIAPKYHDQIFKRFQQAESSNTRKYGGNGLGLAISKSLIELLGGEIGVYSIEGKGSTFFFSLPVL